MSSFLEVKNLCVNFPTEDGLVKAVDNLSFSVEKGKTLGIVGESGSGKSVTSLAILGLHKGSKAQVSGQIFVGGVEVNASSEADIRKLRGNQMAMIFQDSLTSLNPFYTIGDQIIEAYQVHNKVSKADGKKHAIEMLDRVGIPEPQKRVDDYPHQFSGGMRQRAMIAMALSCNPSLLIAAHASRVDQKQGKSQGSTLVSMKAPANAPAHQKYERANRLSSVTARMRGSETNTLMR